MVTGLNQAKRWEKSMIHTGNKASPMDLHDGIIECFTPGSVSSLEVAATNTHTTKSVKKQVRLYLMKVPLPSPETSKPRIIASTVASLLYPILIDPFGIASTATWRNPGHQHRIFCFCFGSIMFQGYNLGVALKEAQTETTILCVPPLLRQTHVQTL